MFYRYAIGNKFEEPDFRPIEDVIRDVIVANDKEVLLHFLNKMGHESPFAKKLNEMIDHDNGRWMRMGEGDQFFDNEAAFEQFVSDLATSYEKKTGIRFAGHLYSKDDCLDLESENYDVDCYLDRFVPDMDDMGGAYDYRLSGFKEMPKPVPATKEEIDEAISNMNFDFTEVQYSLKLNPSDIQYIFESENPMEAFKDIIRNAYSDTTDDLVHEQARGFHIELPVISEEDAVHYALEKLDKELPFDYHLDTIKVDCVVYLKDTERPVNLVGKEISITPASSVEWLTEQIKPSAKVISAISSELSHFYDEDEFLVAFPIKKTLREIIDEKDNIKIPKGTRCGFFNPPTGDVGKFGIPISKDIEIPKEKAQFSVDGIYNTFALKDIFGKAIFDKPKEKSLYSGRYKDVHNGHLERKEKIMGKPNLNSKSLEKYILGCRGQGLNDVVFAFNDYLSHNSNDVVPSQIVEVNNDDMESKYNGFNEFCSNNNITPLEVASFMASSLSIGKNPLTHFEVADYAIIDRDGLLGGANYGIVFPTNNELKTFIASFSKEICDYYEAQFKADVVDDCHPIVKILDEAEKQKDSQR